MITKLTNIYWLNNGQTKLRLRHLDYGVNDVIRNRRQRTASCLARLATDSLPTPTLGGQQTKIVDYSAPFSSTVILTFHLWHPQRDILACCL